MIETYYSNYEHDSWKAAMGKSIDSDNITINEIILNLIKDIFKIAEGKKIHEDKMSKKEINDFIKKHYPDLLKK